MRRTLALPVKSLPTQIALFVQHRPSRRNIWLLARFLLALVGLVVIFSVIFHYITIYERRNYGGEPHSWMTGFYWTLTVMSTLGFGDITFKSDLGRLFSVFVLLSGVLFLLILLPFTFIQFFYQPWIEARDAARAPDEMPEDLEGHVVIVGHNAMTVSLIERCRRQYDLPYVMLVDEREDALRLKDEGYEVMVGNVGEADSYERVRLTQASMLVTALDDQSNTKVTLVARSICPNVPITTTVNRQQAASILKTAGATHILALGRLTGESLARRTLGGDALTHEIDAIGTFRVAEANAARTPLVGKTIAENRLGDFGVVVLAVCEQGVYKPALPDTVIGERAVLVLGGTKEQLESYDEGFAIYNVSGEPVVLIGGGTVGQATAKALTARGVEWRMVENNPNHRPADATDEQFILGDARDEDVLIAAGIQDAPSVLITPEDDALNIYLAILCRKLCPKVQVVVRALREGAVPTLHQAGADFVMSTASLGASRTINLLRRDSIVPIAEGLNIWRVPMPESLAGKKLRDLPVRAKTDVTVVASVEDEVMEVNPDPTKPLPEKGELLLIGDKQAEAKFDEIYGGAD